VSALAVAMGSHGKEMIGETWGLAEDNHLNGEMLSVYLFLFNGYRLIYF
jgi:hypothetical protein